MQIVSYASPINFTLNDRFVETRIVGKCHKWNFNFSFFRPVRMIYFVSNL